MDIVLSMQTFQSHLKTFCLLICGSIVERCPQFSHFPTDVVPKIKLKFSLCVVINKVFKAKLCIIYELEVSAVVLLDWLPSQMQMRNN